MKTKSVLLHTCDHCSKKLFRASAMVKHENLCSQSPENKRKCFTCSHLFKMDGGGFFCGHPDKDGEGYPTMHTVTAIKKGLLKEYPERFKNSVLMPSECDLYENKYGIIEGAPFD